MILTYHTRIIGKGKVLKWNTVEARDVQGAIAQARGEWYYSGGDEIVKEAVFEYRFDDVSYGYQWAPYNVFEGRKNLLEVG